MRNLRTAYHAQKANAKKRGIGWELTFAQWVEWWGEDIHKRGNGHDNLQMQRIGDSGPYALGNIRKGYPRDNSATRFRVWRNRRAEKAKKEHEAFLDALTLALSEEPKDEVSEWDEHIRETFHIHSKVLVSG